MKSLKGYSSKRITEQLEKENRKDVLNKFTENRLVHKTKSNYQVWQEGFHPQQIISEYMFQQKTDYIHMNPVRRKLVSEPWEWMYSSAGFYYKNEKCILDIEEIEW